VEASHALIELGGILLVLAVLGRLAARLDLPSIPLFLIAGLLVGEGGVVPLDASAEFIEVGAQLGIVLLLLLLGLEYTPEELQTGLRRDHRAGIVDLVANAAPGLLAGLLLGWSATAAVLLAGVTYVSSSGIIAKLLADLGRIGNRETPVVLSILVIEDLVMAIFLPVMAVLLYGGDTISGAASIALTLVVVLAVIVASPRFSHHVSRAMSTDSAEMLLLSLLGATLLVAGIAERFHVSAAVGAFLVGLVLSGHVAEQGRALLEPLRDVFAGIFFVFFGLQVDPATLPGMAVPAAVLAALTAASKYGTGWWAAGQAGIGPLGRRRAGASLIARGEFSIVLAGLGVSAGIEDDLGPLAAAYVLILAVTGAVAMRFVGQPSATGTHGPRGRGTSGPSLRRRRGPGWMAWGPDRPTPPS
jgi:CPA2 family monovalent cation:H+ antiporter-2